MGNENSHSNFITFNNFENSPSPIIPSSSEPVHFPRNPTPPKTEVTTHFGIFNLLL